MPKKLLFNNKILSNEKGMTLIEVLLATFLAVILSLPLLSVHNNNHHAARMAQTYMHASNLARSLIEIEKAKDYDAMSSSTVIGVTLSNAGTVTTDDDLLADSSVVVTDNGDDTQTITVTVTWDMVHLGGGQSNSVSLATIVADTN